MFGSRRAHFVAAVVVVVSFALAVVAGAARPSRELLVTGAAHQNSRLDNFKERVKAKEIEDVLDDIEAAEEVEEEAERAELERASGGVEVEKERKRAEGDGEAERAETNPEQTHDEHRPNAE